VAVTNPLIVALDVPTLDEAEDLARALSGEVGHLKVGLELFGAHGPEAVRRIAAHAPVFLDLKLHDIPTTVGRAARVLGGLGVQMLTVHATGAGPMVAAAVEGLAAGGSPDALVLAVTVLTSMSDDDLASVAQPGAQEQVPRLARVATAAGAQGLVCAPRDLTAVRAAVGPDTVLVTPGVRPAGGGTDDHARAATPAEATAAGADHLVVGRPVTRATDPVADARAIVAEATARRVDA
jgi:orotidine-5'-phosphate decarboxylase